MCYTVNHDALKFPHLLTNAMHRSCKPYCKIWVQRFTHPNITCKVCAQILTRHLHYVSRSVSLHQSVVKVKVHSSCCNSVMSQFNLITTVTVDMPPTYWRISDFNIPCCIHWIITGDCGRFAAILHLA